MAIVNENLAPCIAVVGPANAGKSSLLHQLDEKLSAAVDSFYVIKGSPDGSGRYQYRAPSLREELKEKVKGAWGGATVEQIREWVGVGRRNLSLALLDFGGLHNDEVAAGNARMLSVCSHYLLVTREDEKGADLWKEVCHKEGLRQVAHMRSALLDGPAPSVLLTEGTRVFQGRFQIGVSPDDPRNDCVLTPLSRILAALARPLVQIPYIDLRRQQRWTPEMIGTAGGQAPKIELFAKTTGVVVVGGGQAPIWAYLGALKCALNVNPQVRFFVFDPKQPQSLVEIPRAPASNDGFPAGMVALNWRADGALNILEIERTTEDKLLPAVCAQNLEGAPAPGLVPSGEVGMYGGYPIWLGAVYARWLAAAEHLSCYDGGMNTYVRIW